MGCDGLYNVLSLIEIRNEIFDGLFDEKNLD